MVIHRSCSLLCRSTLGETGTFKAQCSRRACSIDMLACIDSKIRSQRPRWLICLLFRLGSTTQLCRFPATQQQQSSYVYGKGKCNEGNNEQAFTVLTNDAVIG